MSSDLTYLTKLITGNDITDVKLPATDTFFCLIQLVVNACHPNQLCFEARLQTSAAPPAAKEGIFRFSSSGRWFDCCCSCGVKAEANQKVPHAANCLFTAVLSQAVNSQLKRQRAKIVKLLTSPDAAQVAGVAWQFGCPKELLGLASVKALTECLRDDIELVRLRPGDIISAWHWLEDISDQNLLPVLARVVSQILPASAESLSQEELRVQMEARSERMTDSLQNAPTGATSNAMSDSETVRFKQQQHQLQHPESDDKCKQCRSRTLSRTLLPCAHLALCQHCVDTCQQCPKCGASVLAALVTYIC